jgi:hypothetical protein
MKHGNAVCLVYILAVVGPCLHARTEELCQLQSPDGLNAISVSRDNDGRLFYQVKRRGRLIVVDSAMGLRCEDEDFSRDLVLQSIGPVESRREQYELLVGNKRNVDTILACRTLTLRNDRQSTLFIDLAASSDGVAWRYRIGGDDDAPRVVIEEMTDFCVPLSAKAWLQPYHAAGKYTPAYEDFYFRVRPGALPPVSREKPGGWCLPALFDVSSAQCWMLITESGTDASYCACHLDVDKSSEATYGIAFAFADEVTGAKSFDESAHPASVTTRATPWRVIIAADRAGDLLTSTLITDLAAPCRIDDTSWIETGRASWSWWSHPEDKDTEALYNSFTDMAAEFGWEYTLFDAGWWNVDLAAICRYANEKGVKPLIWAYAGDFYDPEKRRTRLDEFAGRGIKGVKVDFWCSDRQKAVAAMQETLKDAAQRKLVVNFHGCTVPRGWQRTWPNLLTAEAVLGTECYFYEPRYPAKAAELNTILPFTRNLMGPMDITPVAMTIRKFPRETTAAHEIAASIVFTSGIIHYADSVEQFGGLPQEVKAVLKTAPAAWDQTVCLVGSPGQVVVLARRAGKRWFIAGLNGTKTTIPISLDTGRLGTFNRGVQITEGKDPLMQFTVRSVPNMTAWQHHMPGFGGFVLMLEATE